MPATEALLDRAHHELDAAHKNAASITERRRGELMVLVAAAKAQARQSSPDATSRIFEVTGARATARSAGPARFWRDARTHTVHDPVADKLRESTAPGRAVYPHFALHGVAAGGVVRLDLHAQVVHDRRLAGLALEQHELQRGLLDRELRVAQPELGRLDAETASSRSRSIPSSPDTKGEVVSGG